jgi:dolichol-phosphate mannosyltransferase
LSKEFFEKHNSGRVMVRKENPGLASSVLDGFKNASGDILVVMDADLSHPPEVIPRLLAPILEGEADFVIGSRYIKGGGVEGWAFHRQIISRIASWLGRVVLGGVHDPASGFFAIRAELVKNCDFEVKGFKICTELLTRCRGSRVVEVPYVFKGREKGKSKLKFATVLDYLNQLLTIAYQRKDSE